MKRLKPKKKYSFCLPTAALNACAGLLKGKSLCIQHLRVTKRYRTDQAGREACRYLVQLAAQGRATSKTRSGCLGPCSISFWKSPNTKTAQSLLAISPRAQTHLLGKRKSFYSVGISLAVCDCYLLFLHCAPKAVREENYYRKQGLIHVAHPFS